MKKNKDRTCEEEEGKTQPTREKSQKPLFQNLLLKIHTYTDSVGTINDDPTTSID